MEEHNEVKSKLTYKDQIKISVLVILGFTITMIGGAYAYFSATVTGEAVTNTVQAAILAGIDFEGGQNLVIPDSGIYPGWYGVQSVTINKPDGLTEGVGAYSLTMDPTVDPAYGDWVTYEVYKTTDSGKTITRVEGEVVVSPDGKVSQTDDLTFVGFTETSDAFKKGSINSTTTKFEVDKQNYDMATFETITYIFVYHFTNPDIDQNAAMGKNFTIEIDVEMINQFEEDNSGAVNLAACQADYQTRGLTPTADEHFTYEEVNGALRITAYSDAAPKDVIIPCEINDIPVEILGKNSFADSFDIVGGVPPVSKGITSVVLPDTIRIIEGEYIDDVVISGAFLMNQLTEIDFPNSLTEIGPAAFAMNQLTDLTIPDSVTVIETNSFANNQIATLSLGNAVETIKRGSFAENLLTTVNLPNTLKFLSGFESNQLTSLTIPEGVTEIGEFAFQVNSIAGEITIPTSVMNIGMGAFNDNASLTTINVTGKTSESDFTSAGNDWGGTATVNYLGN